MQDEGVKTGFYGPSRPVTLHSLNQEHPSTPVTCLSPVPPAHRGDARGGTGTVLPRGGRTGGPASQVPSQS